MINSLNFSLFPSDELLTFAKGIISVSDAKKTQLPVIVPFLTNLTYKCDDYQAALERDSKSPFTVLQGRQDGFRSSAFFSFRCYCEHAQSRQKEGWSLAASNILDVLRKHGWSAHTFGYKSKTGVFTKIISELKTKHDSELELIQAGEILDELALAQLDFEALITQAAESVKAVNEPTVAETRPELVGAIKALFQIISLQEISGRSRDLETLTTTLNGFITSSLATVKASETRAQNKKKDTDETAK